MKELLPSLLALAGVAAALGLAIQNETPVGQVAGRLRKSQQPVAAQVVLIPQNGGAWRRAKSTKNGEFELKNVPVGRYRALAETRFGIKRHLFRGQTMVRVDETQTANLGLELTRIFPTLPTTPRLRDPERVRQRARDILNARFNLSPQLLETIRLNNRSRLPLPIVLAQAGAESSFRPHLVGRLDEIGLFQLRPSTAQDYSPRPLTNQQLLDPALNTRLATRYLADLHDEFGNTRIALAAYNQGQGRTRREGLYPIAQIYADAILQAAYHADFRNRIVSLDPALAAHWR